jgi:hypothetical protein
MVVGRGAARLVGLVGCINVHSLEYRWLKMRRF